MDQSELLAALESLPYILGGLPATMGLILGAMAVGFVLGVPLAVGRVYGGRTLRTLAKLYVWLFRGVPILVQMYLFYFGILAWLAEIPALAFLHLDSAFLAAIVVLGLTSAAYQCQIFKGAIQGLPPGQLKAALALGLSRGQAIRRIILPQALRLAIPAWTNEYSILLKDSALAFVIGVMEIMSRTRAVASATHQPLPLSLVAGIIFFVLTWAGLRVMRRVEDKVRIKGYTQQGAL